MFVLILKQIIKMFFLMMIGFICCRTKLIDHQGNKTLSNLLLMAVTPCMIIDAFQVDYSQELLNNVFLAFALSFISHVIAILITNILIRKDNTPNYSIERFSSVYSNCGFMGIPLIYSILGSEGVLYIATYIVAFNALTWTHGLLQISGVFSAKQLKKGLLSPVMISILVGFLLFLFRIQLPELVGDTVSTMADLTTPLAMIIAGVALAQTDITKALKNKRIYFVCALRLLIIPVILLFLFALLPLNYAVLCTVIIAAACPTASTGTMMALLFDRNYQYASEIFAFSTILSMVSIPLIVLLTEQLLA